MNLTKKNLALYALALVVQGVVYNMTGLINQIPVQLERNFNFALPIDSLITFIPETVWLYSLYYIVLVSGFLLAFDDKIFKPFFRLFILMSLVADLFFVLIPVNVPLQDVSIITQNSFTYDLFNLILTVDTRSNCFPSLHCAHSFLISYWFWKSDRFSANFKILLLGITISIVVATLTIKQHWFVDIIGAVVLFIILMRTYGKRLQNQPV